MKNIVLTGFMGTGKTSVGRLLAERLSLAFVDMDAVIEQEEGRTIAAIFAADGEDYFRRKETALALRLSEKSNQVISTGGGIVKNPANIAALRKSGVIVCLYAAPEIIAARTATKGERPVLDREAGERLAAVKRVLKEREKLYADCDYSLDSGERTPRELANEIVAFLKQKGQINA